MDDVTVGDLAGFCPEGLLRSRDSRARLGSAIRGATTMRRDDDFLGFVEVSN